MFVVIKGNQSKEVKIIDIYNSNSWRLSGEAETVCVVPVIVGALGMFSNGFEKHLDKLEAKMRLQVIQKSALFGMARILRKLSSEAWELVLVGTFGYLLSSASKQDLPDSYFKSVVLILDITVMNFI